MHCDFIEIGTSDFDTLIEKATADTVGISIEPIRYYLDQLPNRPKVEKVNCAIAIDNKQKSNKVYYVPVHLIEKHKLPWYLRGCNSIGGYHPVHIHYGIEKLVRIERVDTVPLGKLLKRYNVKSIKFLKLDTEGFDCYILKSLVPVLRKRSKSFWPKLIQFESNSLTPKELLEETVTLYETLGYKTIEQSDKDTKLILEDI